MYGQLGLPYIPPELREDAGEIEAADGGDVFGDLITERDIRGMVHCHTVYSDGRNTVAEMAQAAASMGMAYITITDHSPAAAYAGGVKEDRLPQQWREIAEAEARGPIKILRGTESDILRDGELDYPRELLESLPLVIASRPERHHADPETTTRPTIRPLDPPAPLPGRNGRCGSAQSPAGTRPAARP